MGNRFSYHRTDDLKPCKIIQPNKFFMILRKLPTLPTYLTFITDTQQVTQCKQKEVYVSR